MLENEFSYRRYDFSAHREAVKIAESIAASRAMFPDLAAKVERLADSIASSADELWYYGDGDDEPILGTTHDFDSCAHAIAAAIRAAASLDSWRRGNTTPVIEDHEIRFIYAAAPAEHGHFNQTDDLEILESVALREAWDDHTLVSPDLFSPDAVIERQVIFAVNDLCIRLCELIAQNSRALDHIDWRLLEQIIATALHGIGFEIEQGRGTKDGGKDVVAFCTIKGHRHVYYVEIKHWRSRTRVGIAPIEHFIEVNIHDRTEGGLFLSSSGFSSRVYAQLSQIAQRRVQLGNDIKIVSLCQHFVQRRGHATWEPQEVLPRVLLKEATLS